MMSPEGRGCCLAGCREGTREASAVHHAFPLPFSCRLLLSFFCVYFCCIYFRLILLVLFFSLALGHNFVDPIPLHDLPTIMGAGSSLAGASLTSKSQTTVTLPGVSSAFSDVYEEYVPRSVPRATRSVGKRGRVAGSSSSVPIAKKARQSSTSLGTQVIASMLLGEHINTLCPSAPCFRL